MTDRFLVYFNYLVMCISTFLFSKCHIKPFLRCSRSNSLCLLTIYGIQLINCKFSKNFPHIYFIKVVHINVYHFITKDSFKKK